MRRQTADTLDVSGEAGRSFRLDPFHLPARIAYTASIRAGAPRQTAVIAPESVVIGCMMSIGAPLYLTVPVSSYRGVLLTAAKGCEDRVALRLHHANGDLAVPLFEAEDSDDVIADWQAWGRALGRPLLIEDAEGIIHEPYERIGGLIVKSPKARRANRFFAERRPRFLCGRSVGGLPGGVLRGTEIIARD